MRIVILVVMIIAVLLGVITMKRKELIIRKAEKLRDYKRISKVIYKVYGDTYPYKNVYNPEVSYKCYLSNQAISYIALDKWKLLGHVALLRDKDKSICEMATAFVNPKYRGNGTLKELVNRIINDCLNYGDVGIYVNSVCGHTYSQKVAYKAGLNECAIMLGKMVPLNFKNIDGEWEERESLVTSFRYLKEVKEKELYMCGRHKKIVEEIYKGLGVKVRFIDDNNKDSVQYLASKIYIDKLEDGSAYINIAEAGVDIVGKVIQSLNILIDDDIKSIIVTMNLHKKSTKYISSELERYGLFFSGVLPGDDEDDLLLMQFITENIDYSKIKLLTDKGKMLLDYIKNEHYYANERKEINEF